MRKAGNEQGPSVPVSLNPTRRALLGGAGALAALGAGPLAAGLTNPAPVRDAELVRLCERVVAIKVQEDALFASGDSIEDDDRIAPLLVPLADERGEIIEQLEDLGPVPSTWVGVRSMAAAALALAPRSSDGVILADGDDAAWLAYRVAQVLCATQPDCTRFRPNDHLLASQIELDPVLDELRPEDRVRLQAIADELSDAWRRRSSLSA